jgi:hypothetical protein
MKVTVKKKTCNSMSFAFWRKACLYRAETLRHSSPIRIKFFV